jgi:hypothetical protein
LNLSQELKLVLLLYFGTLGDGYFIVGQYKIAFAAQLWWLFLILEVSGTKFFCHKNVLFKTGEGPLPWKYYKCSNMGIFEVALACAAYRKNK